MPSFPNPFEVHPTVDAPGIRYRKLAATLRQGLDLYCGWRMTDKQEDAFARVMEFFVRIFAI